MRGLADTIERLRKPYATGDRLAVLDAHGNNPGALVAKYFVPDALAPGAPLVVVLHGCTQNADGYDHGSGWSALAREAGFAVLFPEQARANNANLCFNWFEPRDARRGTGESESIRQMVVAMCARHALDARRVFVTGLSAGGAMTAELLAAYPDVFAGGAVIAGLPSATASGTAQALARMRTAEASSAGDLAMRVRAASDHIGSWPRVSVWHGDADPIVAPANGEALVRQWTGVHGLAHALPVTTIVAGHRRRQWRDGAGVVVVEHVAVARMGHGTPVDTHGPNALGAAGPHILEAGISSTRHIAHFWGIAPAVVPEAVAPKAPPTRVASAAAAGPGKVIENALRAAGLMR